MKLRPSRISKLGFCGKLWSETNEVKTQLPYAEKCVTHSNTYAKNVTKKSTESSHLKRRQLLNLSQTYLKRIMKEYMSVKNVKKNFRKCNVVNVNSSYVRSETRRFIIKVQENKHKRIPKNKLEPFFFMDRNDDEYEDCVPSLIQQSLNSIMDDRDNISSDQELELNYLDSSGEHYKIDTNYSMGYTNTSLPQALSTKSSGGLSSVNTNNSFLPIDKKNYLTQPLALKSSRSVNCKDDFDARARGERGTRNKIDNSLNPNKSFTSGGQSYYSLFNTNTITFHNGNIDTSLYMVKNKQVKIPLYQPFVKVDRKLPSKIETKILEVQKILRASAEEGILMIENKELLKKLNNNSQLIKSCEDYGVIHTTYRQFSTKKQIFHSLNLDLISHESILWCLRSLKRDEMTPNEKAIQSRIKEAFCYKVTTWLWEQIMASILLKSHPDTRKNQVNKLNSNNEDLSSQKEDSELNDSDFPALETESGLLSSAPEVNKASRNKPRIKVGGTERRSHYTKKFINTKNGKKLYYQFTDCAREDILFEIEEDFSTTDSNVSNNQQSSYIIYPAGETWYGYDQSPNEKVDQETYSIFIDFLKEYFTDDLQNFWNKYDSVIKNEGIDHENKLSKSKKHRNSTEASNSKNSGFISALNEDKYKAIPGGRYGCAQFAKTCGPQELSKCSLGRLSQMVQKAINEEIIKYQKTLLVWSEPLCSDIPNMFNSQEEINQKKREINHKLELMKQALISILVANPEGVSLAQLPAYIKKKLHFNYSLPELGFAKLKDLILSMGDEIKIDNKSNNHPYAVLINPEAYHKGYPSSEDFHAIPNQFPGYANYGRQSSDMSIPTRMIHGSKDYEMHNHKYNNSYSMTPTNYYPMFPNFQQHNELRRNQSSSSFQSADKFNPNANGNDSFYVPQATSLYGTQVNQPQLNISHCRNNTGSDIGYENNFPIFSGKLKQNNLSQDYSQYPSFNGKVWQPIEAKEELIEVNSSLFLSENSSNFGFDRSRSISPKQHERIVSNLNNPNFGGIDQKFVTPNSIAERFSEEEKTETKRQGSISCDFKEVTNATEAPQQAKPTVQKQIHPNTAHNHSKLVPTSKIFLPSNKSKAPQKQAETFNQEIKSVSRLKAKADQN